MKLSFLDDLLIVLNVNILSNFMIPITLDMFFSEVKNYELIHRKTNSFD